MMKLTMCDVASEVFAHDDVPCRPMPPVELLLDLGGNVLLDVVLLKSGGGNVDALLLHLLAHVNVLDYRFWAAVASFLGAGAGVGGRGGRSWVHSDLMCV